jgi:uncharacterized Ntn-hydrolase superfamily protein
MLNTTSRLQQGDKKMTSAKKIR